MVSGEARRRPIGILVWRLSVAQALYLCSAAIFFAFSALVGRTLAPEPWMVTLPIAAMTIAAMVATLPASLLMRRHGRRAGFVVGTALGTAGAGIAAASITVESFALFCVGNALMGLYQAFAIYYRFAAADVVPPQDKGSAVGWVLTGGILAALLGPSLGTWARSLWPGLDYVGAFVAAGVVSLLATGVVSTLRLVDPAPEAGAGPPRPLRLIAAQTAFIVGILNAAAAYAVMSFVMSASPLAVVAAGHGVDAAAGLTRWHLLGMFAPSLVSGRIVAATGPLRVLVAGSLVMLLGLLMPMAGQGMGPFNVGLLALGVGWNLLYVGATTLLTQSYRPEERARVQGVNELVVCTTGAIASFAAGAVQSKLGWQGVNALAVPFLVATLAVTLWSASRSRLRRTSKKQS